MELIEYIGFLESRLGELELRVQGVESALMKASGVKAETDPTRVPVIVTGEAPVQFAAVV